MTHLNDDDDDWQDLEKASAGTVAPEVTIVLSKWKTKSKREVQARAQLFFRRDAAAWLHANGPRFRVQIGGRNADGIRLIPDAGKGRYEFTSFKKMNRISLGRVTAWPNEPRETSPCTWRLQGDAMVLQLPKDFTRPTEGTEKAAAPPAQAPAPVAPIKPALAVLAAPKPIVAAAPTVRQGARITDHRVYGTVGLGDPEPGRSALDLRQGGKS